MSTTCPGGAAAGSHAVADEEREYFEPYLRDARARRPAGRSSSSVCRPSSPTRTRTAPSTASCARRPASRRRDIQSAGRRPPPALHRQDDAARPLPGRPAHLRPGQHHRGAQHLRHDRQAHAHLGVAPGHGPLVRAQRAHHVDDRPAPRRPAAEHVRLRPADQRRPAVRRPARRHRRRARRHRPPGAAHRPDRRPRRDRHLHHAVLRAVPRREGAGARHRPDARTPSCASACSAPSRGRSPAASASPPPWASTSSTSTAWASSSGPGMAAECPVKQGMHVWSDHLSWSASTRRRSSRSPTAPPASSSGPRSPATRRR